MREGEAGCLQGEASLEFPALFVVVDVVVKGDLERGRCGKTCRGDLSLATSRRFWCPGSSLCLADVAFITHPQKALGGPCFTGVLRCHVSLISKLLGVNRRCTADPQVSGTGGAGLRGWPEHRPGKPRTPGRGLERPLPRPPCCRLGSADWCLPATLLLRLLGSPALGFILFMLIWNSWSTFTSSHTSPRGLSAPVFPGLRPGRPAPREGWGGGCAPGCYSSHPSASLLARKGAHMLPTGAWRQRGRGRCQAAGAGREQAPRPGWWGRCCRRPPGQRMACLHPRDTEKAWRETQRRALGRTCYGLEMRCSPKSPVHSQEYSEVNSLDHESCDLVSPS